MEHSSQETETDASVNQGKASAEEILKSQLNREYGIYFNLDPERSNIDIYDESFLQQYTGIGN